eukprot:CAMPEP_0116980882 /NCGR_PEP_ID=MMETSP0467-20121206/59353_1 /TAXON_ID=283647 /ORGANISM="Mesodinium pulex, Strain SPMC105" /LENGTH=54 /DNA_ID=CAMNT_0004674951 /DNA_START=369 /DNA_END=533 /DNA_ORIENTATION=-
MTDDLHSRNMIKVEIEKEKEKMEKKRALRETKLMNELKRKRNQDLDDDQMEKQI